VDCALEPLELFMGELFGLFVGFRIRVIIVPSFPRLGVLCYNVWWQRKCGLAIR
jgi:hypothetical protein